MRAAMLGTLLLGSATGCTESQRNEISHIKSDLVGLNRVVTLYDDDGEAIRTWEGRLKVEVLGGSARFLDDDGNAVIISGTFVIEEVD